LGALLNCFLVLAAAMLMRIRLPDEVALQSSLPIVAPIS
jgi:hypothetical protein